MQWNNPDGFGCSFRYESTKKNPTNVLQEIRATALDSMNFRAVRKNTENQIGQDRE